MARPVTKINVAVLTDIPANAPIYLRPTTWHDYARVLLRLKIGLFLRMRRADESLIAVEAERLMAQRIGWGGAMTDNGKIIRPSASEDNDNG